MGRNTGREQYSMIVRVLAVVCSVSVVAFMFLASIYGMAVNKRFYNNQYSTNRSDEATGVSLTELSVITSNLIDYLAGKRDNLDMTATVKGEVRQVFDSREKEHMVDVVKLFSLLIRVIWILLAVAVGSFVLILLRYKRAGVRYLCKSNIVTAAAFFVVAAVIGVVIYLNFDWFWVQFHLLAFSNDLWMLDPEVSVMINMFPLEFFYRCCSYIVIIFVSLIAVLLTVSGIYLKRTRSR